jgi:hypothetical protein
MRWLLILLLVVLRGLSTTANNLFFGVTHSGKTTTINVACGLDLPVAAANQVESTPADISAHECLGSKVIDSNGLFDYRADGMGLSLTDVLKKILHTASETGVSSVMWVWSSRITVGNYELEEVFMTLKRLLPETLPLAVVDNKFPGSTSMVPALLSEKFDIPVLRSSLSDSSQVQNWIRQHTHSFRIQLPADYENYLLRHDVDGLRAEMAKLTLAVCDVIQGQITTLQKKLRSLKLDLPECMCSQDCRRCEDRCGQRIGGTCVRVYPHCWEDNGCHDSVRRCNDECSAGRDKRDQRIL